MDGVAVGVDLGGPLGVRLNGVIVSNPINWSRKTKKRDYGLTRRDTGYVTRVFIGALLLSESVELLHNPRLVRQDTRILGFQHRNAPIELVHPVWVSSIMVISVTLEVTNSLD